MFSGTFETKKNVQRILVLNLVKISRDFLIFISLLSKITLRQSFIQSRFDTFEGYFVRSLRVTRSRERLRLYAHLYSSYGCYLLNLSIPVVLLRAYILNKCTKMSPRCPPIIILIIIIIIIIIIVIIIIIIIIIILGSSAWRTVLPLQDLGFNLNKREFRDAVKLRYDWPVEDIPSICSFGEAFTVDYSLICKLGGFITQRHNELKDLEAGFLSMVCGDVEIEAVLQDISGEHLY